VGCSANGKGEEEEEEEEEEEVSPEGGDRFRIHYRQTPIELNRSLSLPKINKKYCANQKFGQLLLRTTAAIKQVTKVEGPTVLNLTFFL